MTAVTPGAAQRPAEASLHVAFRLRDATFVLPIAQVREVVPLHEATPVPLGPPLLAGLVNLRGEIVPAVDLRPRLGPAGAAGGDPAGGPGMLVVVRAEAGTFGLVADEVHDVLALPVAAIGPLPANLAPEVAALAAAVCRRPDALLLVLDLPGVAALLAP